jgi:hypothetical protein
MTEPEVLTLILDGQKTLGDKVETMGKAVVRLETKVENWEKQRDEARVDHDDCREEMDQRFKANNIEHGNIIKRLEPIERLHEQQEGGTRSVSLAWKIVAGFIGTAYLILSSIAIGLHW